MRHIRLLLLFLFFTQYALADSSIKARLSPTAYHETISFSPLNLSDGSRLTIVSPSNLSTSSKLLSLSIEKLHQRYTEIFGQIPNFTTSIKLMDEAEFFKKTGAPYWTNAIYYKNEIMIPISIKNGQIANWGNISRALRHEYTHAVIHALTDGRCPGWLDEGLAQWAEGVENDILLPVLRQHLNTKGAISFSRLQSGFTKIETESVPAAYAQSFYVTRDLLNRFGFGALRRAFSALRAGKNQDTAFIIGFNMNATTLEKNSIERLKRTIN